MKSTNLGVVEGEKLVTQGADFTVHDETLEINVSHPQARETGSLVAATRLETDEAVLDNVDSAHAVATGNGVDGQENLGGVRLGLAVFVVELDGETLFEVQDKVLWGIRGLGRVDGQLPHVLRGSDVGVFEDAGFVRAVGQVLVHGPGLALGAGDGDVGLGGVVEEIGTALEAVVELGVAPWSNDLDGGLESIKGEFEADLVVALAGAAVRDGEAALLLCHGNLSAGNDWACERSS